MLPESVGPRTRGHLGLPCPVQIQPHVAGRPLPPPLAQVDGHQGPRQPLDGPPIDGVVGRQNVAPHISDAEGVLELLWLVLTAVLAWLRPRRDLVAENLLPRHQLAVLTRPTRPRPGPGAR